MGSTAIVYGAGGHGRVVAEAMLLSGVQLMGFVDDGALESRTPMGAILGDFSWLVKRDPCQVALGIGDNATRERIAAALVDKEFGLGIVIHPRAIVSKFSSVEAGAVILAGAIVQHGASVGRGAIINSAAVVEHDVTIGDFAHLSPHATIAGGAEICERAHIGAAATILPGVRVGSRAVVGAGAVVTKGVDAGTTVVGVPARRMGRY